MEDFDSLMKQAVSIKTGQMLQKRKKFETLPIFTKAGLYYLVKYANVRNQGFYQRYAVSDHLKARGNKLFKEDKVDLAVREYEQALSIFKYILNKNPNWKSEGIIDEDLDYVNYEGEEEEEKSMATTIKVALYNNIAACYLSLGDFLSSKAACDEALLLDPTQAKALYRRSKALIADINAGMEEYKAAQEDLKKALELSPEDSVIQQALNKVKHEMLKIKNSSQAFKGMFMKEKKNEEETGQLKKSDSMKEDEKKEIIKEKTPVVQGSDNVKKPLENVGLSKENKAKEEEKVEKDKAVTRKLETKANITKENNEKYNETAKKSQVEQSGSAASSNNKENIKASNEIKELESFLEKRGNELLRVYEASGRKNQANELRENLRKAMAAKQRMEKLTTLDFEKPNAQLQEEAERFGLDLNDPDIKEELLRIQKQHLQEIRNWIGGMDPNGNVTQYRPGGGYEKKSNAQEAKSSTSGTNNKMSNNHSSALEETMEDSITKGNTEQEDDSYEDMNKIKQADSNSKSAKILNIVIALIAIAFFVISLYSQTAKNSNSGVNRHMSKEI